MNFTPTQIKESRAKRKFQIIPLVPYSPKLATPLLTVDIPFTELEELKKKFEEDRQRIAILKQQRKFKPF